MLKRLFAMVPSPIRAAAVYAIGIGWIKGVSLLLLPLLTRLMQPADFGKLELLSSAAEVGGLIVGAGLVDTLFRFAAGSGEKGRRAAADVLGLAVAITVAGLFVLLPLCGVLSRLVPIPTSPLEVSFLIAAICMEGLIGVPLGWLRMQGRAFSHVWVTAVRVTVQASLVAALVLEGHGVTGVLLAGAIVACSMAAGLAGWQTRSSGIGIHPRAWGRLLGYGVPLVAGGLACFILGSADRWLLAPSVAAAQLGIYGLACKFAAIAALLTQPFELWWYPRRMQVLGGEDGLRRSARTVDALMAFAMLAAVATSVAAPEMVRLLTPPAYHGAAALVPWLVLAFCFQQMSSLVSVGCYTGRTGAQPMAINLAAAAVAIIGYLAMIPHWGVPGAVAATVIAQGVRFALFAVLSRRRAPLPHRVGALAAVAVMAGAAAAIPWLFHDPAARMAVGAAGLAAVAAAAFAAGLAGSVWPRRAVWQAA